MTGLYPDTHSAGPVRHVVGLAASLLAGGAITIAMFVGMAHYEAVESSEPPPEIQDLRVISVPMEAPPPRPTVDQTVGVEGLSAIAQLPIEASPNSAVHVAVVPPDLAALYPPEEGIPPARIEVSNLFTEFKPQTDLAVSSQRIYQQSEVDRIPTVKYRAAPFIPPIVRGDAEMLRVTLVLVLDTRGTVTSARLMKSSGNRYFDNIVMDSVKTTWEFTPAMKNGKLVRCMLQQTVTVTWDRRSLFGS